jgi:hypothetical protein
MVGDAAAATARKYATTLEHGIGLRRVGNAHSTYERRKQHVSCICVNEYLTQRHRRLETCDTFRNHIRSIFEVMQRRCHDGTSAVAAPERKERIYPRRVNEKS